MSKGSFPYDNAARSTPAPDQNDPRTACPGDAPLVSGQEGAAAQQWEDAQNFQMTMMMMMCFQWPGMPITDANSSSMAFLGSGLGLDLAQASYASYAAHACSPSSWPTWSAWTGDGGPQQLGPLSKGPSNGGRRRARKVGRCAAKPTAGLPDAPEAPVDDGVERSPLLNQVREEGSGKSTVPLSLVLDFLPEFTLDMYGSRYLQSKLDSASLAEREKVFVHVKSELPPLACHIYGNFVVQKLLDTCSGQQRQELVAAISPDILNVTQNGYGCRVMQKAIQQAPAESQQLIASRLKDHVIDCVDSMHDNHVIQKCIEQMPAEAVSFIVHAVEADPKQMACHMYGCRVVQRLLEHCGRHQLKELLDGLQLRILDLIKHPYGNFVVQHLLEHGRLEDKRVVLVVVREHLMELCYHKSSSFVVQKAIEAGSVGEDSEALEEERSALMATAIGDPNDAAGPVRQLLRDRFGNFIVQTMVEHARGSERALLKVIVADMAPVLHRSSHGKRLLSALATDDFP